MKSTDKPSSDEIKFVNPFKTGELENPGVDVHKSRERTEQKLSQIKPEKSTRNSKY